MRLHCSVLYAYACKKIYNTQEVWQCLWLQFFATQIYGFYKAYNLIRLPLPLKTTTVWLIKAAARI
jgi:hypothetical protein